MPRMYLPNLRLLLVLLLSSPPQNISFKIIVNPVFSKSTEGFNFILKNKTVKPNTIIAKCCRQCTQETEISNLVERRGSFDAYRCDGSKSPPITWSRSDNEKFKNNFDSYIQWFVTNIGIEMKWNEMKWHEMNEMKWNSLFTTLAVFTTG